MVQGGLSTTMELVALAKPLVYFPLRRDWEQERHVSHRLDHYRAGIRLDYSDTTPSDPATAAPARAATYRSPVPRTPQRRCEPGNSRIARLLLTAPAR